MSFLEVKNLNVEFNTADGVVRAVNNVSFSLEAVSYTHLTLPTNREV